MSDTTDVALLLRWCDLTCEALRDARHEIDALNVYPVPDGDTGTNLHLTFEAARDAIPEGAPLEATLTAMGRGALVGARGNSGVILSQLLRAGAEAYVRGDRDRPARLVADILLGAADAAYAAVTQPVEGTMLSVTRAAAQAADERASMPAVGSRGADGRSDGVPGDDHHPLRAEAAEVLSVAAQAARRALAETPDQLDELRRAGVVDAGGMGVCVILETAVQTVMDVPAREGPRTVRLAGSRLPAAQPPSRAKQAGALADADVSAAVTDAPGFEVMYLLDAAEHGIPALRARLDELGDSVVVVGGDGLWNVHAHVDDAGAAVEAGIVCGRPHQVRVTPLAEVAPHVDDSAISQTPGRGLVAVAAGDGLASLFADAGAEVVLVGAGRRCSPHDLVTAIRATGSREVLVLPNDPETLEVAETAARQVRAHGVRVAVVPSRAQVQGLAAIAVHERERSFDDDVVHMSSAAGHARHGAVTIATRDAMTMAGPCTKGDSLGIVDGDFAVIGSDVADTAVIVVDRLLSGGGEMVTLVTGDDVPTDLPRLVTTHVERTHPGVDVVVHAGGQRRYLLLIGVE